MISTTGHRNCMLSGFGNVVLIKFLSRDQVSLLIVFQPSVYDQFKCRLYYMYFHVTDSIANVRCYYLIFIPPYNCYVSFHFRYRISIPTGKRFTSYDSRLTWRTWFNSTFVLARDSFQVKLYGTLTSVNFKNTVYIVVRSCCRVRFNRASAHCSTDVIDWMFGPI